MMRRRWRRASSIGGAALLAAALVSACAQTDLGTPCHLLRANNTEASPMPQHDVLQSGSGECAQFICASFDGASPVCTRPCAHEGDPCENGMVCRAALLTPQDLALAQQRMQGTDLDHNGVDDFQEWAAGLTDSLYCAPK